MERSLLELNTPSVSSDEETRPPNVDVSFRRQVGRKIANSNKIKRYRERKDAERKMQDLKRKSALYKMKYYRLLENIKQNKNHKTIYTDLTPLTKVNMLLDVSQNKPSKVEEVKKNLIFGEVIQQQLVNTYQELKSDQKKQIFKKILDGKGIKKYKLRTKLSTFMKFRKSSNFDNKDITSFERKKGKHTQRTEIIKQKIKDFLELEDNSRVCPGKKEFVKKKNVIKEESYKRKTFSFKHIEKSIPKISSRLSKFENKFFCLARPLCIKPMRVSDRDT